MLCNSYKVANVSIQRLRTTFPSPLGEIHLTSVNDALTGLWLPGQKNHPPSHTYELVQSTDSPFLKRVMQQLARYFKKELKQFSIPIAFESSTPFQQRVWEQLLMLPYGERSSYQALAQAVGNIKSERAVGSAVGHNPISIIVPCHRVLGKNQTLTGFDGGLELKKKLLQLEGISYKACQSTHLGKQ